MNQQPVLQFLRSRQQSGGFTKPLLQRPTAPAVVALLDGWMAPGVDRRQEIRHEVVTNGFREEVLLGALVRAKGAKSCKDLTAWASVARDYANDCDLARTHPLACLTTAYLAEAARVLGNQDLARSMMHSALSALEGIEDQVIKAEVLTVGAKICIQFGDSEARSAGVDHCFDAGQCFAKVGDSASRAEVLLFQAVALKLEGEEGLEWVPAELLTEALSLISPWRFKPWVQLLLVSLGHGFCDDGNARGAADVQLLVERLSGSERDPMVQLGKAWLEARRADMTGDRQTAIQRYSRCRDLVAKWGEALRKTLDYRIELAENPVN